MDQQAAHKGAIRVCRLRLPVRWQPTEGRAGRNGAVAVRTSFCSIIRRAVSISAPRKMSTIWSGHMNADGAGHSAIADTLEEAIGLSHTIAGHQGRRDPETVRLQAGRQAYAFRPCSLHDLRTEPDEPRKTQEALSVDHAHCAGDIRRAARQQFPEAGEPAAIGR